LEHNGFELGLVTGYTYADVVPMLRYKKDKLFIAPAIEKGGKKGLVIGIEF
jgi:phosphoglycolate phosphatase-like HAD superfamily hydrolase